MLRRSINSAPHKVGPALVCPPRAVTVRFRRLDARDRTARLALFARLEPEARRARWLAASDAAAPPEPALALGAFCGPRLVGVGELYPWTEAAAGELALAVDPVFRRRGIGRALLERAAALARNRFWRALFAFCAADNAAVLALVRRCGARLRLEPPEAYAIVPLLSPTPATFALEFLDLAELWRERLRPPAATAPFPGIARPR